MWKKKTVLSLSQPAEVEAVTNVTFGKIDNKEAAEVEFIPQLIKS